VCSISAGKRLAQGNWLLQKNCQIAHSDAYARKQQPEERSPAYSSTHKNMLDNMQIDVMHSYE